MFAHMHARTPDSHVIHCICNNMHGSYLCVNSGRALPSRISSLPAVDVAAIERHMLGLALKPSGAVTKPAPPSTSAVEHAPSPLEHGLTSAARDAVAEAAPAATSSTGAVDSESGAPSALTALTAQDVRDVGRSHLEGVAAQLGVPVGRARRAALLRALAALLPAGCAPGVLARRHVEPMDARLLAQALGQARCSACSSRSNNLWCPT